METIKNQRSHPRFVFSQLSSARVLFENGVEGKIRDLSYSGMGLEFSSPEDLAKIGQAAPVNLHIFNYQTSAIINLVYAGNTIGGFCFQHRDPNVLLFLRQILEFCRCGSTMVELGKSLVQDRYKGEDFVVLRGDGPTDLILQKGGDVFKTALLTFLDGKSYFHLRIDGNKIHTGRSIDQGTSGSVSAQMQEHTKPDKEVLKKAIYILLGCEELPETAAMVKLLIAAT
jgi:hypothetical protein